MLLRLVMVTINGETLLPIYYFKTGLYTWVLIAHSVLYIGIRKINSYEIFSLGEKYLQHFTTVNDTNIIIHSRIIYFMQLRQY